MIVTAVAVLTVFHPGYCFPSLATGGSRQEPKTTGEADSSIEMDRLAWFWPKGMVVYDPHTILQLRCDTTLKVPEISHFQWSTICQMSAWHLNSQGTQWNVSHTTYLHVFTSKLCICSLFVAHSIQQPSASLMSDLSHIWHQIYVPHHSFFQAHSGCFK